MPLDIPNLDINKTVIEKDIFHFENKNSIEKEKQYLTNKLNKEVVEGGYSEKYPKGLEVTFLEKEIFLVVDKNSKNPIIFVDKLGELKLNIRVRKSQYLIQNNTNNGNPGRAMFKAGFVFRKNLELHKIVGYKNGNLIIKGKVDTYSKDYYHAWKTILLSLGKLQVENTINSDSSLVFDHNSFEAFLHTGAVTKEILEKINAKGILNSEDYQFGLEFLKKQEEQENTKTHIDEAIKNINSRLNGVTIEMP